MSGTAAATAAGSGPLDLGLLSAVLLACFCPLPPFLPPVVLMFQGPIASLPLRSKLPGSPIMVSGLLSEKVAGLDGVMKVSQ